MATALNWLLSQLTLRVVTGLTMRLPPGLYPSLRLMLSICFVLFVTRRGYTATIHQDEYHSASPPTIRTNTALVVGTCRKNFSARLRPLEGDFTRVRGELLEIGGDHEFDTGWRLLSDDCWTNENHPIYFF